MTNGTAELEDADTIFIIGSNTATAHPLVATRIFRALEKGAKLVVADPRKNQIAEFAHIYLRHKPGTDVALLNGMMKIILEKGLQDQPFIDANTEEFDAFKTNIESVDLNQCAAVTGLTVEEMEQAAQMYGSAGKASIVYCMGITQHTNGVDNVKSLANLAMVTGNIGREGTGVNPLRGQNNVQGACDMGGLPNVFPAYQPVTVEANTEKFTNAWGKPLSDKIGYTITDMIQAMIDGKLKALYVVGENPKMSDPDQNHLDKALANLEFLVCQDIYLTETAQKADVVFAAVSVAEKDGTYTNTERRCMKVNKAIDPIENTLNDWEITSKISTAMGYEMKYEGPEEIFNEMRTVTPSYGGFTYERLGLDGLQWPCPSVEHPGTQFLHKDQFTRGKGLFHAVEYLDPAEMPDEEYPFWLTTGRMFAHYHTGTMTRASLHLDTEQKTGYVEINPEDAKTLGVNDGETVRLATRRGETEIPARISDKVVPGLLFVPFHFAESPANILTNSAFDPIAKIPEYKVCAVKIEKAA